MPHLGIWPVSYTHLEQVPYQVTYDDKLIFPATVAANASAAYTVQAGTPVDVEVRRCV